MRYAAIIAMTLGSAATAMAAERTKCTISASVDRAGKVERVSVGGRGMGEAIERFTERVGGPVAVGDGPGDWRLPMITDVTVKCQ